MLYNYLRTKPPWLLALIAAAAFVGRPCFGAEGFAWEQREGFRRARLNVPEAGKTGFTLMPPEALGIRWTNNLPDARVVAYQNMMNGAGVAAGDFDGDGWCDLYLSNKDGPGLLLRNLGGWRFEDSTDKAGVACTNQFSTGTTFADVNGDGKLDLLVNSFMGPNACFLNLGNGAFTNITAEAGLLSKGGTTSLALADIDGNGSLDLYVEYFGIEAIMRDGGSFAFRMVNGQPVATGRFAKRLRMVNNRVFEVGEPSMLYLNDGRAHFSPVSWENTFQDEDGKPVSAPPDFGLAVQLRDINGDGFPDIYVCSDFQTPDRCWINDGKGHFRAIPREALRNMSYASMGVDFADVDRDGRYDFVTVEMLTRDHAHHQRQYSPLGMKTRQPGQIDNREEVARNVFGVNRGDGTYADLAYYSGLAASDWSWAAIFLDADLDGYEDLFISNGHIFDVNDRDVTASLPPANGRALRVTRQNMLQFPRLTPPKAAFRNRGNLTFEDVSDLWGFNSQAIAHGMALADLDNDGDMDIVLNAVNSPPLIYRNDSVAPRLAVKLKGLPPNTEGVGARIEVLGGAVPMQSQEMLCGGRYLSGDQALRVFAAGSRSNRMTITVTWRSGRQSVVEDAEANYIYEIDESPAKAASAPQRIPDEKPMFENVSGLIAHVHHEEDFDDFARQPSLPKKLSQLGPGIAWCDLDSDGFDDLIVGSGKGGRLAVYRNTGGNFSPWNDSAWAAPAVDDQTSILGVSLADKVMALAVGSSSYETPGSASAGRVMMAHGPEICCGSELPANASSAGPMAAADVAGNGSLELFVGGRLVPGQYPEAASSRLFFLSTNGLSLDADNSRVLEKVGLVSGAVFSDLDGDGFPELITACEWGPVRIFRNRAGKLSDATKDFGMEGFTGLWNGVATVDLDGDGRLDIVAGNWGLNSYYNLNPAGPWLLYHGDLNGDNSRVCWEAYGDPGSKQILPWRDLDAMSAAMPALRERFAKHTAYSIASLKDILGDGFAKMKMLQASTLASTVFLNRGGKFIAAPLPGEAQWSPAMAVVAGDLDGDGNEDIFLSQNYFAVRPDDDRLDAGRGLWLRGDGKGALAAVPGQKSGLKIYGEQRGAALCDFDGDGRVDLAVSQNGATTQLYKNVEARPGLRVRLRGPGHNPSGIGAQVRLWFGDRPGPVREVKAGGGYWSQDSAVQVMGTPEYPAKISIRWPGGKSFTNAVPAGAHEILIADDGEASKVK